MRVTAVEVPTTDVRAVRRKLGLSQSEFAAKFGFQPATLKNWEQGRTFGTREKWPYFAHET